MKFGKFVNNDFTKGKINVRGEGEDFWIKSDKFYEDKPNGYSTIKYDNGVMFEGEMVRGNRHGPGKLIFDKEGMSIEADFYSDRFNSEPEVQFTNGASLQILKGREENEAEFYAKLDLIESKEDLLLFKNLRIQLDENTYEGEVEMF